MPTNTPSPGVKLRPESDRVKPQTAAPQPPAQPAPPPADLHADMPVIPGVAGVLPSAATPSKPLMLVILLAVIAILGIAAWRLLPTRGAKPASDIAPDADATAQPAPFVSVTPAPAAPVGPVVVATVDELSAPWASKAFTFVNPKTQESIPALVVHLPGPASRAYWGLSLNAPYQACTLEFVTSISQLASKYSFRATHPMIASPCDGSVFDPLQVGSVPGGAFVRGLVVQGSSIRPPIAIDIRVEGRSVIADGIE